MESARTVTDVVGDVSGITDVLFTVMTKFLDLMITHPALLILFGLLFVGFTVGIIGRLRRIW